MYCLPYTAWYATEPTQRNLYLYIFIHRNTMHMKKNEDKLKT
jgi:hypothetical protein